MRSSRRVGALLAAAVAAFPLAGIGTPAAATDQCIVLPLGTPEIAIHMTGPDPQVYVPPVSDVTLCVGADVVLPSSPTIEREQCGGFGSCMKYFIGHDLRVSVEAGASLCYTSGGLQTCHPVTVPPASVTPVEPGVTCVGYDLRGGDPCNEPW